jgi:amidophosphoribosyltransferase
VCGILGISNIQENETKTLAYFAMQALQHRGQESAGIVWHPKYSTMAYSAVTQGSVEKLFTNHDMTSNNIQTLIGHTRYSTTGGDTHTNIQPFLFNTSNGFISLVHNGNLTNTELVRTKVIAMGMKPNGTTDSELIGLLIARYLADKPNGGIPSAIKFASEICKGAISLIISANDKMYAYRDSYGIRPLVFGVINDCAYIIASETCALDAVGATYIQDVVPGTVIEIGTSYYQHKLDISKPPRRCIFENIYFSRPDSLDTVGEHYDKKNKNHLYPSIYEYRLELGRRLYKQHPIDADIVIGTPDSGIASAIGYSQESGILYNEGLIKNKYIGRTFIKPTQKMRQQGVKVKLNPIPNILRGKRIVLIDDSIVRGNTCKFTIESLRKAGAIEVHMRVTSPPVTHPCYFGLDFPDTDELAACNMSHNELKEFINADSLGYLSIENCLEATNYIDNHYYDGWGPHSGYCTACFTGEYPI